MLAEGWPSEARRGSAVRLHACDIVARVKRDVEPLQAAAGAAPIPDRAAAALRAGRAAATSAWRQGDGRRGSAAHRRLRGSAVKPDAA
jgi:hypothetical protein